MIRFVEFEEQYIPQMASLLATRHQEERQRFPFLQQRFEEVEQAEERLREEMNKPYVGGLVTLRDDDVIGYLLYEYRHDSTRGRTVYVGYPSFVIHEDEHPRLARLMYTEVGAEWIRNGYFEHVIDVPVGNDELILEMLEQSFHFEQRFAALPLGLYRAQPGENSLVKVNELPSDEQVVLQKMAPWNSLHQAKAPAWKPITQEALDAERDMLSAYEGKEGTRSFIAEQDGVPVAFHLYTPADARHAMTTPDRAAVLVQAATNVELRGQGIGKSIANHSFTQMKKAGYEYIMTDWYTANHLASYFWPKLGFRSYMIRMARTVDARIAWADGQ
ncbi:GNAT family N-acetyltransferase [Sporosarcina sp. GW1-11]|uniref:GNAT family N-acetyltransferase n=1 Tax=Sporosarcina sp. GW1-11 TaxID=2899126 RepID=UPI00294C997A|nr:GNAT family N-acetyltransferase [Sporosarcina sp. GW1-11]MDV6379452.1 GNAT family N-acetyltransferase [Sporosarcina sp. GW1-11]